MIPDDELKRTIRDLARKRQDQTEREHVDAEELAAYQDRTLPPDRLVVVEEHLAWCPVCTRVLLTFQDLKEAIESPPREAEEHQHRWFLPAAAALIVVLLVAGILAVPWAMRRLGSSPAAPGTAIAKAGLPFLDVDFAEERSSGSPPLQIRIPKGERLFVLVAWIRLEDPKTPLQVTLLASDGRIAWSSEPFSSPNPQGFTLVLDRELLPERRYTVQIDSVGKEKRRMIGKREIEIVPIP